MSVIEGNSKSILSVDRRFSVEGRRADRVADLGVLLLNMGGPERLKDIEGYLGELMADREMIRLPLGRFYQNRLARFIASRRAPLVRQRYAAIGGGSPLGEITRRQAVALSGKLGRPVSYAMRYTRPRTADALAELIGQGVRSLVALPLYPQYSRCTTGSALADLESLKGDCPVAVVRDHHEEPGYIEALAENLRPLLADWPSHEDGRVLFVAHSLPLKYVRSGDPYVMQTRRTVELVARVVGLQDRQWRLGFSSRVGPVRWQGPTLEESLARFRAEQVRHLAVLPVSFVAENLETLWDLDIVFREQCAAAGIKSFRRAPAVGESPRYIETLARLARQAAAELEALHG
jgi:ferrochelatase